MRRPPSCVLLPLPRCALLPQTFYRLNRPNPYRRFADTAGTLNIDEHPTVAQRYGITGIPALVFFHEGQVLKTVVGAVPKRVLTAHVDEVLRQIAARGPA
jgi:predicted DsbA family dithiol-disulfide isomerase